MISPGNRNRRFPLGRYLVLVVLLLSTPFLVEARPKNSHQIITDLPEWSTIRFQRVHPEGKYVLYEADRYIDEVYELFHYDIQTGKTKLLSPPLLTSEQGVYQLGGVGGGIEYGAFLRDDFVIVPANYNNPLVYEWFQINFVDDTIYSFGNGTSLGRFVYGGKISADNTRFCFTDDHYSTDGDELYCAKLYETGKSHIKEYARINPAMAPDGGVSRFTISPQSDKVVYLADQNISGIDELFSAGFLGEGLTQINPSIVSYEVPPILFWVYIDSVVSFIITPDASRIIYTLIYTDNNQLTQSDTYIVPLAGGSSIKLVNTPGIPDPKHLSIYGQRNYFSHDLQYFIYANAYAGGGGNLYSVSLEDGQAQVLGGQIVTGGNVFWLHVDGNNKVVFAADKQVKNEVNLYSVAITGQGLHRLSDESVNSGYSLSKDNQSLLFTNNEKTRLFQLNVSTEQLISLGIIRGTVEAFGTIHEGEHCHLVDDETGDIFAVCPSYNKSCNITSQPHPYPYHAVVAYDSSNNFIISALDGKTYRPIGPYSLNETDMCSSNLLLLTLPSILNSSKK